MRKILVIIAVCACIAGASTQCVNAQRIHIKASSNYITRDIPNFGSFDAIRTEGIEDVEFRQTTDGSTSVKIYGSDNVLDYLEVVDESGTLVSRIRKDVSIESNSNLKITISGPALKGISSKGTGDINLIGNINSATLTLTSSGTGDIKFNTIRCDDLKLVSSGTGDLKGGNTTCKTLDMTISGTGDAEIDQVATTSVKIDSSGTSDVKIAGKAADVILQSSGTGDVDVHGLRAETVNATASGIGNVMCYATKKLDANASGLTRITYGGNPATVNVSGNQKRVRPR